MIIPRNRLLIWFAVVVPPFSILAALSPTAFWISGAVIGLFLVAVAVDAWLARPMLAGIQVELPPVIRMSLGQETKLTLRIQNLAKTKRQIRLALPLAAEFASPQEEMDVILPAQSEWSQLTWPCRPLKRGNYPVASAHVEGASPLGFWNRRMRLPVASEIRVYPNLLEERKGLGLLFRGGVGMHAQRQVGKGREFEKLREYVPGDGAEDIHWKATARRGRPVTKVFQIERTQEVYLVIDASRLSARQDALEHYLTSALLVGVAAEQQGDLFGLISFSDRVENFVRARNGKAHYDACREAIYTLQPRRANPDFEEVCSFIRLRLRRRALVIFLTALDDPVLAESFTKAVELISQQHLVLVNTIRPPGVQPLFTGPEISGPDEIYEHLGGHLRWHSLEELRKVLQRRGVQFSILEGRRMGSQIISQYLSVKNRQLL